MTKMYAQLPADLMDPLAFRTRMRQDKTRDMSPHARDAFAELPWKLEDMVGSIWRNVWTGGVFECQLIDVRDPEHRRDGRPVMLSFEDHGLGGWREHLGLWWNDRYVIDYWARVDHLPPIVSLRWMYVELVHLRDKIAQHERALANYHPDRTSCYTFNKNYTTRMLESAQGEEGELLDRVRSFAVQHSLDVDDEILNLGRQGQLLLF